MKIIKNIQQLSEEYAAKKSSELEKYALLQKGYEDGARDILEVISEIVFDKGHNKIPRLQSLITDLKEK